MAGIQWMVFAGKASGPWFGVAVVCLVGAAV